MPVDERSSWNNWVTITGRTGKVEKLREALAQGADINHFDGAATALMYAARRGDLAYVREIVTLGADIHKTDGEGRTALDHAVAAKQKAVIKFLQAQGGRNESLSEADALRASIANGLDVNRRDEFGATPLMRAVDEGKEPLVEILLKSRADVHAATRFGHTALMIAVSKNRDAIAERLLRAGARLPAEPVLLPAVEGGGRSRIAKLIDKYNDVRWKDLWARRVRIEAAKLTAADFDRHPFWETCADEDDDSHIYRPVPFLEPLDHPTIGRVRVELSLADGGTYSGIAAFDGFDSTPFVQGTRPDLAVGGDWITLYHGIRRPPAEEVAHAYRLLGRSADQVFPIRVRSAVELKGQPREGIVEGFAWLDPRAPKGQELQFVR